MEDRKRFLGDQRPRVRLAALLSLLEGHDVTLDAALAIAERDGDTEVQHWAMTWAMSPRPPQKMPNTQSRIELQETVSMRDLIERTKDASSEKLRRLYLAMVSRATYDGGDDWQRVRDLYRTLRNDDERALVITPLARSRESRPFLWEALAGAPNLRQAAVRGLVSLSQRSGSSPEQIADFLLSQAAKDPQRRRASGAIEALSRLSVPSSWRPASGWDVTLAGLLAGVADVSLRAKVLTLLLAIEPGLIATGTETKRVVESLSREPNPLLYGLLVALNPRLGIDVEMEPPEQATIDRVLAKLPDADADRGRELFFSQVGFTRVLGLPSRIGSGEQPRSRSLRDRVALRA